MQVATIQGLSGTGSLRIAAALIERYFPGSKILISSPTWGTYFLHYINLNLFKVLFLRKNFILF